MYKKYRCTSQSKLPGLVYMCIQCLSGLRVRFGTLGDLGWGRAMWSERAVVKCVLTYIGSSITLSE